MIDMTVADVAKTLDMSSPEASKLLSKWCAQGWVARVKRGLYVAIPLDATSGASALSDPFSLLLPCTLRTGQNLGLFK